MRTKEIWMLPTTQRLAAFIDRWEELAEHMGNRTPAEFHEMAGIADAVMPELIRIYDHRHPRHPTRNAKVQP